MNIDLGSPVLEVAIALAFVFFLLSVITSAITEFFAGLFNLRAETLKEGLSGLLGSAEAAEKLLQQARARTELDKEPPGEAAPVKLLWERFKRRDKRTYESRPSYLAPSDFAAALIEMRCLAAEPKEAGEVPATDPEPKSDLDRQLASLQAQEGQRPEAEEPATTEGGGGGGGDGKPPADPGFPAIEDWFDDGMERVSGWYKRRTQILNLLFAAVVAIGLNASTVRIAERLTAEPSVRSAVVAKAEAVAAAGSNGAKVAAGETKGAAEIKQAGDDLSSAADKIDDLKLPIFWAGENLPSSWTPDSVLALLGGWLLTIIAISFGAPFWFDTLGKLSNLRLAGKKPEPEKPKAAQ